MIRWFAALVLVMLSWTTADAEAFKWLDAAGQSHSVESLKGKPVLVHFWASWCPACRDELPAYAAWAKANPDLTLLTVSLDQKQTNAETFLKQNSIDLPLLLSDETQARRLGARALPTTIIINAQGEVSAHHRGPRSWSDSNFTDSIEKLLRPQGQSSPLHKQH